LLGKGRPSQVAPMGFCLRKRFRIVPGVYLELVSAIRSYWIERSEFFSHHDSDR